MDLSKIVVALVGNKCDMEDSIQVSSKEATKLKQDVNADVFLDVSAKENTNINELLIRMVSLMLSKEAGT